MERNRVAGEAPDVGREEVEDGRHDFAQHVNVKSDSGQAADDHHEGVAVRKIKFNRYLKKYLLSLPCEAYCGKCVEPLSVETNIPDEYDRAGHAVSGSLFIDRAVEDKGDENRRPHVLGEFRGHADEPAEDVRHVAALLLGVPDGGLLRPPEHAEHVKDLVQAEEGVDAVTDGQEVPPDTSLLKFNW